MVIHEPRCRLKWLRGQWLRGQWLRGQSAMPGDHRRLQVFYRVGSCYPVETAVLCALADPVDRFFFLGGGG